MFDASTFPSLEAFPADMPTYREHLIYRTVQNKNLLETMSTGKGWLIHRLKCKFCKGKGSDTDAKTIKNKLDNKKNNKMRELNSTMEKTYNSHKSAPKPKSSSPSKSKSPSDANAKPAKRPKGQRTQLETGNHLIAYNNVDLGNASDSASDNQTDNFQNNLQATNPMSMRCAEYLGSALLQDLLQMDKASQEITGHLAYMMANSLHIHG